MTDDKVIIACTAVDGTREPWVPSTIEDCYRCGAKVFVSDATKKDVAQLIADGRVTGYVPLCIPCVLKSKDDGEIGDIPDDVEVHEHTIKAAAQKVGG